MNSNKYLLPTFYVSYILFYLGHWLSMCMTRDEHFSSSLFPLYSKLMRWSSWWQGSGAGPWIVIKMNEKELKAFLKERDEEETQ